MGSTDETNFFTMKVPMATPPGENSVYCSAARTRVGRGGAATKNSRSALTA
jgi:hypothetical protein